MQAPVGQRVLEDLRYETLLGLPLACNDHVSHRAGLPLTTFAFQRSPNVWSFNQSLS